MQFTLNTIWYRLQEVGVKVSRGYIKRMVKDLCDKCGITRAELGIFAGVRAELYFSGSWKSVSFDAIGDLAEKGTDIVFIEKEGVAILLTEWADKYGVAMVNTRGHLTEYGKDLMNAAKESGAHVVIMADYDIAGIKIASESPTEMPWIGANDKMLEYFHLDRGKVSIPSTAKQNKDYVTSLVETGIHPANGRRDIRFKDVDIDFLDTQRVELDAIIARTGNERFFQYIMDELKELYPKRDYNRAIEIPHKEIDVKHEKSLELIDNRVKEIIQSEIDKIEKELSDVSGFIDVKEKLVEIKARVGNVLVNNPHYEDFAKKLDDLVRNHPFFKDKKGR